MTGSFRVPDLPELRHAAPRSETRPLGRRWMTANPQTTDSRRSRSCRDSAMLHGSPANSPALTASRFQSWDPRAGSQPYSVRLHHTRAPQVPGRFIRRCLDSLRSQTYQQFGVVIIDDASTNGSHELLRNATRGLAERLTLIRRGLRAGQLPGIVLAVRHVGARADAAGPSEWTHARFA
jgi:hypothetical protein